MPTFSQLYNLQEQERADRERFQRGQASRRARMPALRRALETEDTQEGAMNTALVNRRAEQQRRDLLRQMEEPGVTLTTRTRPPAGEVIAQYGKASPGRMFTEEDLSGGVFPTPGGGKRLVLRGKKPTKDEMEAILERRGGLGQIEDARRRALGLRPFEETSPENRLLMKQYMDLGRKKTAEALEAGLIAGGGYTPEQAARRVVMEDRASRGTPQRPGDVAAMQGEAAQQESAAERIRKMQEEAAAEMDELKMRQARAATEEQEGAPEREKAEMEIARQRLDEAHQERKREMELEGQKATTEAEQQKVRQAMEAKKFTHQIEVDAQRLELELQRMPPERVILDAKIQLRDIGRASEALFKELGPDTDPDRAEQIKRTIEELAEIEIRLTGIIEEAEANYAKYGRGGTDWMGQFNKMLGGQYVAPVE